MYRDVHPFETIQSDLKSGKIPGVVLLCGKEQFLVDWAKKSIQDMYLNPASKVLDLTLLEEEEYQGDSFMAEIFDSIETVPLLSEKRVIIVKSDKVFAASDKKEGKNSDVSRLCAALQNMPETTQVIFLGETVDKNTKLPRFIKDHGKIYDFGPLTRRTLVNFANKRFRDGGVSLSGEVMDYLIDSTGYFNQESDYNLYTFANDIAKMIAMAEDGVLTKDIVKDTVESDVETFIFSLMNSISGNKKGEALKLIHNIAGSASDVSRILTMIINQFDIMYSVKQMMGDRVPDRIIVQNLGIKDARLKVLKPYIVKISEEKLKEILLSAYRIEQNIKMGLLNQHTALELFVAEI